MNTTHKNLNDKDLKDVSKPVLGVYGLSFQSGGPVHEGGREKILDEISFEISRGEFMTLVGPNGSGKSTLMKLVAGILPLRGHGSSGLVRFLGQKFFSVPSYRRAQNIAYVGPELRAEFPLTALQTVMLGRGCQNTRMSYATSVEDLKVAQSMMEKCFCWHLRDRFIATLSGGERQLVALALALTQGAKVLFLDEALSKMDLNHQVAIGKMLRELKKEGYSILLVSHDLNLGLELADSAIVLKNGKKLCQGPVREIFDEKLVRNLYPEVSLKVGANPYTDAVKVFFSK